MRSGPPPVTEGIRARDATIVANAGMVQRAVSSLFSNALLVLANVPFALAGGVLILVVTGGSLSVGAMVGLVS